MKNKELLPCHVQLDERRETYLTTLAYNDADRLPCLVILIDKFEQAALPTVEPEENGFEVERVFVLDIKERSGAELKIVLAPCAYDFALDLFEVDACVAQPEPVEVGTDREAALPQVLEDFLLVAVERHLVVIPSYFECGE